MKSIGESSVVEFKLGDDRVYEAKLEEQPLGLYLRMRKKKKKGDFWWYIAWIQKDGSLARASSIKGSGLPVDPRTGGHERILLRLPLGG